MDFSLRVNRKAIATDSSPDRDQQFRYISSLRTRFERQGLPIISVDTKKRELIGNFKNHGVKWDRTPVRVNDHDFRSDAIGIAIPYSDSSGARLVLRLTRASTSSFSRK